MSQKKNSQKRVMKRVMIVDDDPWILQTLGNILLEFSICQENSLFICSSAQAAWDKLQEINGQVDIVISDLRTGGTMNGLDFLMKIRANYGRKIFFILMSGLLTKNNIYKARRLGVNGFLKKPFTIEEVLRFF